MIPTINLEIFDGHKLGLAGVELGRAGCVRLLEDLLTMRAGVVREGRWMKRKCCGVACWLSVL
jgi:hypothetical protein